MREFTIMRDVCESSRRLLVCLPLVLVGLRCAPGALAQTDPARFLTVTQWFGTFTRTLTSNGSDTVGGCLATWNYLDVCAVDDRLKTAFVLPPTGSWSGTNGPITSGVNIGEKDRLDCGNGPEGYDASGGYTAQGFSLVIDTSQGTYSIYAPTIMANVSATYTGGSVLQSAAWALNTITGALPASGMVIAGTNLIDLPGLNGTTYLEGFSPRQTNGLLQLTWTLTPFVEQLEVVVHIDEYQTWLPEGNLEDQNGRGSFLTVAASLQKKGGGASSLKAQKFTFALADVSHEPGVCLNSPSAAVASAGPDLKFESEVNQSPPLIQPLNLVDSFTAETTGPPSTNANANVSSFDFGAYGTITVTALVGGSNIVGYLDADPSRTPGPIPLPRRAATSFVADYWKETNGVANLASDDDSESDPIGDTHQGDGFTLYEEYRGFSINGVHTRLNPKKKDLFILNDAGADGAVGLAILGNRTGLLVHTVRPNEFGLQSDFSYSRILNFNHSASAPHIVDQHGIWIVPGDRHIGFSEAENAPGFQNNSTPGTKVRVRLDPGSRGTVGSHIVGSDGTVLVITRLATTYRAATAAHEIGHCCSMYHHGDKSTREAAVLGGPDSQGHYRLSIDGVVGSYTLLHENGTPFEPQIGSTNSLGVKNGTHSGDENCFMRYDCSQGYFSNSDPSVIYLLDQGELTGSSLCTSPAGTGVNQAAPGTPWPRYGDADSSLDRGACFYQTCINDVYASDPKHSR